MIVACERCHTRFQLDDARVPEGGVRVRCSRCKHSFFAKRPGATKDDVIHTAASEAAQRPSFAPGPTQDLSVALPQAGDLSSATQKFGQRVARQRGVRAAHSEDSSAPGPQAGEDESDWQFNDERPPPGSPAADRAAAARERRGERSRGARAEAPGTLEELGSPENWDFLAADEARGEAEPVLVGEGAGGAPAADLSAAGATPRKRQASPERPPLVRGPEPSSAPPLSRLTRAAGGAASALLLLAISVVSLAPGGVRRVELPSSQKAGELELEDLHGRFLENAVAGRLLVVSGRLRNPGSQPASLGATVSIRLLGDPGQELDNAPGLAGFALSEASLREETPERLHERLAAGAASLAWTPLQPGESIAVTALLEAVPLEAQSFAVSVRPAERPPPPPPAVVPASEPAPVPAPTPPPPPPAPRAGKAKHLRG
jgi:predicted Zn finger-like uncharacterized protein